MQNDPTYFRSILHATSYAGTRLYVWGDDDAGHLDNRTSVRRLGVGGRLAVADKYVYWTTWTDGAKQIIDASRGKAKSLADVPEFRLLAAAADRSAEYEINIGEVLSSEIMSFGKEGPKLAKLMDPEMQESRMQAMASQALLLPYALVAVGLRDADKGIEATIFLVHQDAATATENLRRLNARIYSGTSFFKGGPFPQSLQESRITTDGALVTWTLPSLALLSSVEDLLLTE